MKISTLACTLFLCLLLTTPGNSQDARKKRQQIPDTSQPGTAEPSTDSDQLNSGSGKRDRYNALSGMIDQLELTDDQRIEVLAIMRDFASEMKSRTANGNEDSKPGEGQLNKARREEVISRLRSQGLEGKALKQAAIRELGAGKRLEPGNRPKDLLVQKQAELIAKVREVLTDGQRTKLDELLQASAAETAAKAAAEQKPASKPKTRQRPGKGG